MVDIRIQNTKSNLISALITCLETQRVSELKVKDIILTAGVSSRTFYQYYSDINSLVKDAEDSFIADFLKNLEKDRENMASIDLNLPIQDQLEAVLSSTKNTISFCFERKREIKILLSDNGDSRFYNLIFKAGYDEFNKRIEEMGKEEKIKISELELMNREINIKVFIHSMIGLINVLLDYSDRLSPYDIRHKVQFFLKNAPVSYLSTR